jgi:serine/threonine protein kinase
MAESTRYDQSPAHQAGQQHLSEPDGGRSLDEVLSQAKHLGPADMVSFLRFDQRLRWGQGDLVPAEAYVDLVACLQLDAGQIFEIIYGEYLLREERQESPTLEEYLQRFPQYADKFKAQLELHRALDSPSASSQNHSTQPKEQAPAVAADEGQAAPLPALPSYEIISEVGKGGMGVVYKAIQRSLQRLVALKVVHKARLGNPGAIERFQREARAAACLSHPNIVTVYDAGQAGDIYFYAMEFLEGIDLEYFVELTGPLPVDQACDYVRQTALGLQHASERGVVHRDIKPANLVVTPAPGKAKPPDEELAKQLASYLRGGLIKILDMGLVRFDEPDEDAPALTTVGAMVGTPNFMAPEQILDPHSADIRADLYSLGCTLYYLLSARLPFPGRTIMETLDMHRWLAPRPVHRLRPQVPADVSEIVLQLMAKRPEERCQTPAQLIAMLDALSARSHGPAPSPAAPAREKATKVLPIKAVATARPRPAGSQSPDPLERTPPPPQAELKNLKEQLADQIEKNDLAHARGTVARMLQLNPNDSDALAAQTFLTAPEARVFTGHEEIVWSVVLSKDGQRLLSGSHDETVRLWDVATGQERLCMKGHSAAVRGVAISPEGTHALSASDDKTIRLWDLTTGRELRRFIGYAGPVACVAFSSDGKRALAGTRDRAVQLWEVASGNLLRTFKGHSSEVNAVAFFPHSGILVSAGRSSVRLWQAGKQYMKIGKPTTAITCMACTADLIAFGCSDCSAYLWDQRNNRETARLAGHRAPIAGLAFTPDGKRVLSGSKDGNLRLWNAATGIELWQAQAHADEITSVDVSADGYLAIAGSKDKTISLRGLPM